MRNGISENLEFSTLRIQRGSAIFDTCFKFGIQLIEGFLRTTAPAAFHQEHCDKDAFQDHKYDHSDYSPLV